MKVALALASYRTLREQPMWKLLRANRGQVIVALLQSAFGEADKELPSAELHERVSRDMAELEARGEEMVQTAAAAVAEWLSSGWLTRRLPPGAQEELYELSVDALAAIRFVNGALKPRTLTTESRLSLVIQQLTALASATDANPETRLKSLQKERDRIDRDIEEIERHGVTVLPMRLALERSREVIGLARELVDDFRVVREDFDRLNRQLRQQLIEHDGSRGDVLGAFFSGVDVISESEPGKTFEAFWRVLVNAEHSEALYAALDAVLERDFSQTLAAEDRRFLLNLTTTLMDEGGSVHEVMRTLATSLKQFVQSREFLEQRRIRSIMREATQAALAAKDLARPRGFDFELQLSSSNIDSISRRVLYDPDQRAPVGEMLEAQTSTLDMASISRLFALSGIDERQLRRNIAAVLEARSQASIADVIALYPADQGLGTILGYIDLATRHGEPGAGVEKVSWQTHEGGHERRARIPTLYFVRERLHEFAA